MLVAWPRPRRRRRSCFSISKAPPRQVERGVGGRAGDRAGRARRGASGLRRVAAQVGGDRRAAERARDHRAAAGRCAGVELARAAVDALDVSGQPSRAAGELVAPEPELAPSVSWAFERLTNSPDCLTSNDGPATAAARAPRAAAGARRAGRARCPGRRSARSCRSRRRSTRTPRSLPPVSDHDGRRPPPLNGEQDGIEGDQTPLRGRAFRGGRGTANQGPPVRVEATSQLYVAE